MKKFTVYLILGLIMLVGFSLRNHNLTVWPREGATFDEFAWTFLGLSLWEKGIPTSWSPHQAYKQKQEYYNPQGTHFVLVTPYLEHPPLFGLFAGGFAKLNQVKSFDEVTITKIRPLAIILGVISILSVFLLAQTVFGDQVGLVSAFIYAIMPTAAIGSRLVQNENFFIPLFLFSLYFANRYLHKPSQLLLSLTTGICALLPLAKVPWVAASLAVTILFIVNKKKKVALIVGLTTILAFCAYLLYGFILDKELFVNLWRLQLARYDMAFNSIFALWRDPLIADRTFVDGWIYFGWAAMFLLLIKDFKKYLPVAIGFLAYLVVFVFAIPSEPLHGWYRYPLYPFLAMAIAAFLKEYVNKNFLATGIFFLTVGLALLQTSWGQLLGFSYFIYRFYLIIVFLSSLPAFFSGKTVRSAARGLNVFLFIVLVCLSVWSTVLYNEQ